MANKARHNGREHNGQHGMAPGAAAPGVCLLCSAPCSVEHAACDATFACTSCMPYRITYAAIALLADAGEAHRHILRRCARHEYLLGHVLTITVGSDNGFRLRRRFTEVHATSSDDVMQDVQP